MFICSTDRVTAVEFILASGGDITAKDSKDRTALDIAVENENWVCCGTHGSQSPGLHVESVCITDKRAGIANCHGNGS